MGGGMVHAATFHGEALILLDTPHRLQLHPLEGQHGSVVFPNDEHVMDRRAVLMVLSLERPQTKCFVGFGDSKHG